MRLRLNFVLRSLGLLLVGGLAAPASAQCQGEWLSPPNGTFGSYGVGGINASVEASATWYPSVGFQTRGPQLVIAGNFSTVAGGNFSNIAGWDGSRWLPFGSGIPGGGFVFSVCPFNSDMIVGGNFGNAGGITASNIAKWNGTAWSTMGTGVAGSVFAMCYYNGNLYVGGDFTSAGGVANTTRLARWTGSAWQAVGASGGANGVVSALAVYNNELIVGGNFTNVHGVTASHIAKYNGTTWSALGTGTNDQVYSLCTRSSDSSLYVGGRFTSAGGVGTGGFARWDGSWHANGGGFAGQVYAMSDYFDTVRGGSELVMAGTFPGLSGAANIAQWDGAAYTNLGSGGTDAIVRTLTQYNQSLAVGGDFNTAGGKSAARLALWSGAPGAGFSGQSGWAENKPGMTGPVNALLAGSGGVYAGGDFIITIGGANDPALNVAFATPTSYGSLTNIGGGGGPPAGTSGPVYSMGYWTHGPIINQHTDLVVGGSFGQAAGAPATNIAIFQSFGGGWAALGSGINAPAYAIQQFGSGTTSKVVAAGAFTSAGGVANTNHIAQWNGAWTPLGTGLNNEAYAMTLYNGELIVGGGFSTAGGVSSPAIARWDGTAWHTLGGATFSTFFSGVRSLVVFNNQLIAGGDFSATSPVLNRVAAWNGTTWTAMDNGLPGAMNVVNALAVHNGELYAGGAPIILRTPLPPGMVARWNGSSWATVDGLNYSGGISALASGGGALWAGGAFGVAGGHTAPYLSRLQCACYANCDNSTTPPVLNVNDFTCFLQQYAGGAAYANCDGSTAAPALNVGDFTCFLQQYALGCP